MEKRVSMKIESDKNYHLYQSGQIGEDPNIVVRVCNICAHLILEKLRNN